MKVSKIPGLGQFGVYIDDVDLANISHEEWMEIGNLHMKNLVTILRNVNCTKERYAELVNKFGDVRVTAVTSRKYKKKYNKDWAWVIHQVEEDSDLIEEDDKYRIRAAAQIVEQTANGYALMKVAGGCENGLPKGMFADGELLWHSNESGTLTYTPGVALLGHQNMIGSATGFITTADYYQDVSDSFRKELDEMIIQHRFMPGKINPGAPVDQDRLMNVNMCPVDDIEIPLVIQSPGGIKGMHYSINTVYSIKGLTLKESHKVFERINKELFTEKYVYDHWYKTNNDLLFFDNSITLHRRTGSIEGRLAYRLPHDYTHLQDGAYQPYLQEPFQSRYNNEIRAIVKQLGIKNFKLPKRSWKELFSFA